MGWRKKSYQLMRREASDTLQSMKLTDLTPEQFKLLAEKSKSTVNSMRQIVSGRRGVTAARAAEIEKAADSLGYDIDRGNVCSTCARCPFYKTVCRQQGKK